VSESIDPFETTGGGRISLAPGVSVASSDMRIQFVRSSGPGGQNVNKVNTRIELWIPLPAITGLTHNALVRLRRLAGRRITIEGELHLSAQTERSQERNRQAVMDRLRELLIEAMAEPKPRRATRPSKASKRRRLEAKRHRGEVKSKRKSPRDD
jgi:ribosome-associated protein